MSASPLRLICLLSFLLYAASAPAQEGHPVRGVWVGYWGPASTAQNRIVVVLDHDGKNVSGVLNPGPNAVPLQKLTLDPARWMVHFEADARDRSGAAVHYVVDGKLEDIGLPNRRLVGSWNIGPTRADFKLVRQ